MRRFVRAGDLVFDVGANMGVHTAMLAQLVGSQGRVVAFEPNPELLPTLERTLEALPNVTLYPCALSDESKESVLFVPEDHSMASLADWTSGETSGSGRGGRARRHGLRCQERRMDELLSTDGIPSPDFIKCDVEGAELLTFKGGRKTLDRPDAPIILFEANINTVRGFDLNRSDAADFLGGLRQAGYQFLEVHEGGALRPVRPSEFEAQNILAVPQARSDLCPELTATGPSRGTA
jgi:FkbM family methyltransferase